MSLTRGQDHVYVNADIFNNQELRSPAVYNFNSTTSILDPQKKYELSVIRMTIPMESNPIFYFDPSPDAYVITLTSGGVDYKQAVEFIPGRGSTYSLATSPFYYGVFEIQWFLDMVNTAIQRAFVAAGSPKARAPYIAYNPEDTRFNLYFTQDYLANDVGLFMNTKLYFFFYGFRSVFYGNNLPTQKDFGIPFQQQYTQGSPNYVASGFIWPATLPYPYPVPYFPQTATGTTQTNVWYMTTEEPTLNMWYDTVKIILTSPDLPIKKEILNPVLRSNQNISTNQTLAVITDFTLDSDLQNRLRGMIVYNPTAEYRWCDCFPHQNLSKFSIQIFTQTKDGTLRPFYIPYQEAVTIKLLFRATEYE